MEKTFNFGKIDYKGVGKRNNSIVLQVEYKKNRSGKMVFSASCEVLNSRGNIIACGQMLDDENVITKVENPLYKEIVDLWHKYHLNDLHFGTKKQERALKQANLIEKTYLTQCDYLKSIGLYEDKGYKYGTDWIYYKIPKKDEKRILALFNNDDNI